MQIMKKTEGRAFAQAKKLGAKAVIKLLKDKGLTGRSGGGFPTGQKWEMVFNEKAKEKYIICNADEGEPGTFKDKFIFKNNPEAVIEGILIAAYVIGAKKAYIYLRGEYEYLVSKINRAIRKVKDKTKAKTDIEIVLGQGAYICGEETAIINSIEGFRGQPNQKPPFPTTEGLFGKPTIINNVETLANVPLSIFYKDWDPNLRLYCLSGDVTKPGVYEIKLGIPLCDVVQMAKPKNKIKAIFLACFGGALPYCEMPLTPEEVKKEGCIHGTGAIVVVDETHSVVDVCTNIAKFFEFESCGKCTPCREGTMRILALLVNISMGNAAKKDLDILQELAEVIKETAFCGLGKTATLHVLSALKFFRKEFEAKCK
jgi:NADH:ubiquinone oxidoreductase subunit F (NADH-binding)